ncbi:PAS domain S-box protein [Desulfovibrio psychrotolerans]|uniref:histidine kinase n=1 Tax=Desulfovibrio psychrotolerans TaxID=415242 RepID=A0A7J0BXM8_9BACT|nr:PAS domain S-box protein [Desulfovibrio psychrotolerans]GFM38443.1 histidine kinase [Desulfovibrio psychrotolerans]
MSRSIAQRMNHDILITFTVIACLFVALGSFMQLRWKDDNIHTVCRLLDTLVAREQDNLANELFERRTAALNMRLADMSRIEDMVRVTLYDAHGAPIAGASAGADQPMKDEPALDVSVLNSRVPYIFEHDFSTLHFTRPLIAAGEVLGWVRIDQDLTLLRKQLINFFGFFFALLFITFLCMKMLLLNRLRRSVVTPLSELGEAMRGMDAGTASAALPVFSRDTEIINLSSAFGELMTRLDTSYRALDHANAALKQSEQRLSRAISATSDAIWEWSYATGDTYFSPRWYEMLGYRDQELPMCFGTWKSLCHPEDHAAAMVQIDETIRSGGAISYKAEFRMRTKNGGWKWILGRGDVIERDTQGNPALICGTHTDITERRFSEEKHRVLFQSSPDAIFLLKDNRFVDCNLQTLKMFGCTREQIIGLSPGELSPPLQPGGEDSAIAAAEIVRDALAGRSHTFEWQHRRLDGSVFMAEVSITAMQLLEDTYVVAFLRDISERKQMQELMVQNEKMISVGGLAAGMAHEINNPLGGILQGVQNISRRLSGDVDANRKAAEEAGCGLETVQAYMRLRRIDRMLEGIRECGQRAADIVSNMLNFSRKSETSHALRSLPDMAERAIALTQADYDLNTRYDFRNIEILREYAPNLPRVECSEMEIVQVLFNLIRNAAQAIARRELPAGQAEWAEWAGRVERAGQVKPAGHTRQAVQGRISIRLTEQDGHLLASISDNGPGMDEETRRRVFEPFFTTKPPGEGTGLGLSVCYLIVHRNHRGDISVESAPGKGATFHVRLPLPQNG